MNRKQEIHNHYHITQWSKKLSDLQDVDVTWVSDWQILKYFASEWKWKPSSTWGGGGASKFTDLDDTPTSYSWQAGKVVRVKWDESGLEFADVSISDEKVALKAWDTPGYLEDKIDGNTIKSDWTKIAVDWSVLNVDKVNWYDVDDTKNTGVLWSADKIQNELNNKADVSHTHQWNDIDKTGSKLSDIEDVPNYSGNAGKVLTVKADESGVEWTTISGSGGGATKFTDLTDTPSDYSGQAGKVIKVKADESGLEFGDVVTTDEKVALNSSDTPGYLEDKIDNNTIIVDTSNNVIKVDETKFASKTHTHQWNEIDKTSSKLSDIEDVPDYTGNAWKVLAVNATEDGIEYKSVASEDMALTYALIF